MSQYSLAPTFPLLRLVWTKYGASALWKTLRGRVRIHLLTYEAISACISVTWPTCLHARCLTKYVLTHNFSPLTWFLCCWNHTRCSVLNQLQLVYNLVLPPTLGLVAVIDYSTDFQSQEAATGKVRSTMAKKRVRQTISDDDDDDDDDDRHYFRNVYTHIKNEYILWILQQHTRILSE